MISLKEYEERLAASSLNGKDAGRFARKRAFLGINKETGSVVNLASAKPVGVVIHNAAILSKSFNGLATIRAIGRAHNAKYGSSLGVADSRGLSYNGGIVARGEIFDEWAALGYAGAQFAEHGVHCAISKVRCPERFKGWHWCKYGSRAANWLTFGICVFGNFDLETPADRDLALASCMTARLLDRFGLGPDRIWYHREFGATSCPGSGFVPLPEFRNEVGSEMRRMKNEKRGFNVAPNIKLGDFVSVLAGAVNRNGHWWGEVRFVLEMMGFEVGWRGGIEKSILANGVPVKLKALEVGESGNAIAPVADICSALGWALVWKPPAGMASGTIEIMAGEGARNAAK